MWMSFSHGYHPPWINIHMDTIHHVDAILHTHSACSTAACTPSRWEGRFSLLAVKHNPWRMGSRGGHQKMRAFFIWMRLAQVWSCSAENFPFCLSSSLTIPWTCDVFASWESYGDTQGSFTGFGDEDLPRFLGLRIDLTPNHDLLLSSIVCIHVIEISIFTTTVASRAAHVLAHCSLLVCWLSGVTSLETCYAVPPSTPQWKRNACLRTCGMCSHIFSGTHNLHSVLVLILLVLACFYLLL